MYVVLVSCPKIRLTVDSFGSSIGYLPQNCCQTVVLVQWRTGDTVFGQINVLGAEAENEFAL